MPKVPSYRSRPKNTIHTAPYIHTKRGRQGPMSGPLPDRSSSIHSLNIFEPRVGNSRAQPFASKGQKPEAVWMKKQTNIPTKRGPCPMGLNGSYRLSILSNVFGICQISVSINLAKKFHRGIYYVSCQRWLSTQRKSPCISCLILIIKVACIRKCFECSNWIERHLSKFEAFIAEQV